VPLTFKTEAEIRALVKNGDGNTYGVTLTEHGAYCSCLDAMHRGVVCKHAVAVCVRCLQKNEATENPIHLWWVDGIAALCGETHPRRFWIRWTMNALNWSDIVCQPCVHAWQHPVKPLPQTRDEFFASQPDDQRAQEEA
jgi:hypothetical protein